MFVRLGVQLNTSIAGKKPKSSQENVRKAISGGVLGPKTGIGSLHISVEQTAELEHP